MRAKVEAENKDLKEEIAALKVKAASAGKAVDKENGAVAQSPAIARVMRTRSALSPSPAPLLQVS